MKKCIRMTCFMLLSLAPLVGRAQGNAPASLAPELRDTTYLYEVIGHLYRWYLDEMDVHQATATHNEAVLVRTLHPELDEGDSSRFAEVVLPVIGVRATVKQANYRIEELGVVVSNDTFKITRVDRVDMANLNRDAYTPVHLSREALRSYLFQHRNDVQFPSEVLLKRLRKAARAQIRAHAADKGMAPPKEAQAIHCSSLSPVANELWVFWELGRVLLQFSSDLDIANEDVWEHDRLRSKIFDVDDQVVVTLDEVPGSNAYLTRDQVGRALYNCVVLGKRVLIEPLPANHP